VGALESWLLEIIVIVPLKDRAEGKGAEEGEGGREREIYIYRERERCICCKEIDEMD
jgi:hypothetical protein